MPRNGFFSSPKTEREIAAGTRHRNKPSHGAEFFNAKNEKAPSIKYRTSSKMLFEELRMKIFLKKRYVSLC